MTGCIRSTAVSAALAAIEKQFGKGAITTLGDVRPTGPVPVLRSGSVSLDIALGTGGYPRGRIVEVFGPESSGKTTLALHAIAEAQRAGGVAVFIDAEHALDVTYAASLGVTPEALLVSQPDCGEQGLEVCDVLVGSSSVDLVVIDSVAALVPRAEIEGEMGDQHMGLHARLMSQALRKLAHGAHQAGAVVMFINQLRHRIGVTFGSPETTTGGNALKFYSSVRLDVRKLAQIKAGEEVIGNRARVKVVKNKLAPPFRSTEFDIVYGAGIDAVADVLDTASEKGLIEKSGAWYSLDGDRIGQGRDRARGWLAEHPDQVARLERALRESAGLGEAEPATAEAA